MQHMLALTVIADDQPGIVDELASVIRKHGGNWLESAMSRLAGKFAGILLISVDGTKRRDLIAALSALENDSLYITVTDSSEPEATGGTRVSLTVTANDRPGIVEEISAILAADGINVEKLTTRCENAPMSGELLFYLDAALKLPMPLNAERLRLRLEDLSDDLVVELKTNE